MANTLEGRGRRQGFARTHRDLEVYKKAFDAAMLLFTISRSFPSEERFGLTDQIRRSSRGVCANLAEAWRKRQYERAFASKISDAEAEAAETQVWLEFAVACDYMSREQASELYGTYNEVLGTLVGMRRHAKSWTLSKRR